MPSYRLNTKAASRSVKGFFFALLSLFILAACQKETIVIDLDLTPERTVLVYITGDNDLSTFGEQNIASMMEGLAGTPSTLKLLVYQDDDSRIDGLRSNPTIWSLYHDGKEVVRQKVKEYPEQISTDPQVMQTVIQDAFQLYPAKERGLIFWGHGSGWIPKDKNLSRSATQGLVPTSRSYGPDRGQEIDIWEIRQVLENVGLIYDFLSFDACHMATVEVAYELKDFARYLLLSPLEIMGAGFPYDLMVPYLAKTNLDHRAFAQAYMEHYHGLAKGYDGSITLIDTQQLEGLATLYSDFLDKYDLQVETSDYPKFQEYGRASIGYSYNFLDIESVVSKYMTEEELSQFHEQLDQTVLYKGCTPAFIELKMDQVSGLAVYLPYLRKDNVKFAGYEQLRWTTRVGAIRPIPIR